MGIEFQFVAIEQAAGLVHVHVKIGDRAVMLDAPVPVPRRVGLKVDALVQDMASERVMGLNALYCVSGFSQSPSTGIWHTSFHILFNILHARRV